MRPVVCLPLLGIGWLFGLLPPFARAEVEMNEHEQTFKNMLDQATLIGHFTVAGREDQDLTPERYTIRSVEKIDDQTWRFNVRIQYKQYDLALPLPLTVHWADDTPVITLTRLAIPPLGTFSARVLFYEDSYAGTWEHVGAAGGHLFGRIERPEPDDTAEQPEAEPSEE